MSYRVHRIGIVCLMAVAAFATPAFAVDPVLQQMENAFVALGDQIRPSVVNIDVKGPAEGGSSPQMDNLEEFFRQFGIEPPQKRRMPDVAASGSGFIYDKQGHIVTNNHVVATADVVKVKLHTGKIYDAKVVGKDKDTDLAVIKIEPDTDLQPLLLGDSDALRVGQFTIAAGSPRGLEDSLSFGHVTALGRDNVPLPGLRFRNLIQTDAAINLGNSGGPLCDIQGHVIGVNTAIVWGAESLGFAVPVNTVKKVVPILISEHKVSRGYLGVNVTDTKEKAQALNLPDDQGAFVDSVREGTPAAEAGVKPYDVIRKVNGQPVKNSSELVSKISDVAPGQIASLEVWRDGKTMTLDVTVREFPGEPETAPEIAKAKSILGITVDALPTGGPQGRDEMPDKGVIVTDVEPKSPASEANISPGDIITEIAKQPVTTPDEFLRVIKENAKPGGFLLVRIAGGPGQGEVRVLKVPADFAP